MGQRLKIEMLLDDQQLLEFRAIVVDRRATVDGSHDWLRTHGYRISRNAVWNYWKRERAKLVPVIGTASDADCRSSLARCATQLTGRDLITLAQLAAIMARSAASESGMFERPSKVFRATFEPTQSSRPARAGYCRFK